MLKGSLRGKKQRRNLKKVIPSCTFINQLFLDLAEWKHETKYHPRIQPVLNRKIPLLCLRILWQ